MANLRKSGKRAGTIAAFLLSVSLSLYTGTAGMLKVQAADLQTEQVIDGNGTETAALPAVNAGTTRAEAGIIEVLSGFVDAKGKFWKMKSGSGFLIANKEPLFFNKYYDIIYIRAISKLTQKFCAAFILSLILKAKNLKNMI